METKPCPTCGREFTRKPGYSQTQWSEAKFCTRECVRKPRGPTWRQRGDGPFREERSCVRCTAPYIATNGGARFCSRACLFWSKVDQSGGPDACWPWTAARNEFGYGVFYPAKRGGVGAHREALAQSGVTLADGAMACHHCDNPPCCNPRHLYAGDAQTNSDDRWSRHGFSGKVGEEHWKSKLTNDAVRAIRAQYGHRGRNGKTLAQLAAEHGVSISAVHCVINGTRWKETT